MGGGERTGGQPQDQPRAVTIANGYRCQWAGCPFVAVKISRRGESMEPMKLYLLHARQFQGLRNQEALQVSQERQGVAA